MSWNDVLDFLRAYPSWVTAVCLTLAATIVFLLVVFRPSALTNPSLDGDWTGVFREYRAADKAEDISSETMTIKVRGSDVSANLSGSSGVRRSGREAHGQFQGDTLILHYFAREALRVGGAAYVLKGDPAAGLLKGYWLGYDPELNKLMACPYVLGRTQDTGEPRTLHQAWLDQSCYPSLSRAVNSEQARASAVVAVAKADQ